MVRQPPGVAVVADGSWSGSDFRELQLAAKAAGVA